ncbi:MAG: GvpL/GvpF family gas vesicle protein [Gemmatimonadota bacterium]
MTDDWKKAANDETEDIEVPPVIKHPLKPRTDPDVVAEVGEIERAAAVEEHARPHGAQEQPEQSGLYLYGIVRARGWRGLERRSRELQRVRYRDIEALVNATGFELPRNQAEALAHHQKTVEGIMRRMTILPAPFGIVFKGKRPLILVLQDQYLVFDEGLSLLDGHWELRLHISSAAAAEGDGDPSDAAMDVYSELRRFARAAVPFPSEGTRVMSAAFLVDRTSWVEFIERIEEFGTHHRTLTFDVTGPWPAYDFVRIVT